jgi:hypothetical protein
MHQVAMWQRQDGLIACRRMIQTMNCLDVATMGHTRELPVCRILYNITLPCTSGNFITTKSRSVFNPRVLSSGRPARYERSSGCLRRVSLRASL